MANRAFFEHQLHSELPQVIFIESAADFIVRAHGSSPIILATTTDKILSTTQHSLIFIKYSNCWENEEKVENWNVEKRDPFYHHSQTTSNR